MQIRIADRFDLWPVDDLVPYERNSRLHDDDQVEGIAASIAEFGFVAPIIVDTQRNRIAAGHGRLMAAKRLGMERVPVVAVDHLSEAQFRAYVIADNKHTDNSRFDETALIEELTALRDDGYDLAPVGFSAEELADLLPDEDDGDGEPAGDDPDAIPDAPETPVSMPGDLWRLGGHRVLCGDSTSIDDADRLMDGGLADCLWTDPPYNVNYEGTAGKIMNDHMAAEQFGEFLRAIYDNAFAHMAPGAGAYIAHADTEGLAFRREFEAAGFYLASCLVWRKNSLVLGRADYHWQHEPILYGWKPGAAHRWYGERNKTTIAELGDPAITTVEEDGQTVVQVCMGETTVLIRGASLTAERVAGSVFFQDKPKRNGEHPTMKPVELIERQLANSTKPGDVVLDLFGGSGSTLIAAHRMKRTARLMELDPRFVDVIVKRWQDLSGRTARLDETGETFAEVAVRRQAETGARIAR